MNISTRIKRIEERVSVRRMKDMEMVLIKEINGKYYIDKCGKPEETSLPENNADGNYVIFKSFSLQPSRL